MSDHRPIAILLRVFGVELGSKYLLLTSMRHRYQNDQPVDALHG